MLDSTVRYYKKTQKKIQETLRERYQNLSEEEINRKREYMCKQYKNPS